MPEVGNPKVYNITLADGVAIKAYPTDAVPAISGQASRVRGILVHSRNGFDLKISGRAGGIAAGEFYTVEAGQHLALSTYQNVQYLEFQSTAADVVELLTTDTLGGAAVAAGPNL